MSLELLWPIFPAGRQAGENNRDISKQSLNIKKTQRYHWGFLIY